MQRGPSQEDQNRREHDNSLLDWLGGGGKGYIYSFMCRQKTIHKSYTWASLGLHRTVLPSPHITGKLFVTMLGKLGDHS
jgi:hypothetical protein